MPEVHVVYGGKTEDLSMDTVFPAGRLASLGLAEGTVPSTQTLNADQVKNALAQHYDVGRAEFQDHFVELNPNGNISVRPNTGFGR